MSATDADVSDRHAALAEVIANESDHLDREMLLAESEDVTVAVAESLGIDTEAAEIAANVDGPDVDEYPGGVMDR